MAIFNSYVKLPEGNQSWLTGMIWNDWENKLCLSIVFFHSVEPGGFSIAKLDYHRAIVKNLRTVLVSKESHNI